MNRRTIGKTSISTPKGTTSDLDLFFLNLLKVPAFVIVLNYLLSKLSGCNGWLF